MKVLQISHLYPVPYDRLYGIAIHKQIKALLDRGCEARVMAPTAWTPFPIKYMTGKWRAYSKVPRYEIIDDVEVFYPRFVTFPKAFFFASSGVRMYYGLRKSTRELRRDFDFDLIHAHMVLPDGYAGMLLSQAYNKPLVVTVQATDLDITAKRNVSCLKSVQRVLGEADAIISPSPRLSEVLHYVYGIIPRTIGYGIDPVTDIYSGSSDLWDRYRDRRILLSASRLIPTKGIDLNLYALKALVSRYGDLLYLIIGDGPIRQELEQLVTNLDLKKYVEFIGQLPHRQVMEYMSICKIFSMPSWQETFGLVYIEAMAHAKVVIGVRGQGVDGIVEHGKTGMLVKPRDVDSLVEALDFLLSHPEEARAMGERACRLVLENYTWERCAQQTLQLYKGVVQHE